MYKEPLTVCNILRVIYYILKRSISIQYEKIYDKTPIPPEEQTDLEKELDNPKRVTNAPMRKFANLLERKFREEHALSFGINKDQDEEK